MVHHIMTIIYRFVSKPVQCCDRKVISSWDLVWGLWIDIKLMNSNRGICVIMKGYKTVISHLSSAEYFNGGYHYLNHINVQCTCINELLWQ
jgi:hypothetical protein